MALDPDFAAPAFKGDYDRPAAYGGLLSRLLAWVIDNIVVGIIAGAIGETLANLLRLDRTAGFLSVNFLINATYNALMIGSNSRATLGKMALGLKVTTGAGGRVPYLKAFLREFSKYLSGLVFGIGYVIAAFNDRKQALHDMIAGTVVVRGR